MTHCSWQYCPRTTAGCHLCDGRGTITLDPNSLPPVTANGEFMHAAPELTEAVKRVADATERLAKAVEAWLAALERK